MWGILLEIANGSISVEVGVRKILHRLEGLDLDSTARQWYNCELITPHIIHYSEKPFSHNRSLFLQ
jgi:hypothetical protein